MRFIDIKTNGGGIKGKIALYCDALNVTRQGFYWYLKHRDDPWKYEGIADKIRSIVNEDECNDTYGRCRMYQAMKMKYPDEDIPGGRTIYRMKEELLYGRYNTKKMTIEELKTHIWRYFIIYWNNRRICSANDGLPPMVKRQQYYDSLGKAA